MCGIIGYLGDGETVPILLNGLKRLEYRGYDSAGICVVGMNGLDVVKEKGRISELEKDLKLQYMSGSIGIAHTRWATHGEPSKINAHPHVSEDGNIAIVHNGIIENYSSLREILELEGFSMKSKTDSEVLAHLIERFYIGDLKEAVVKALQYVEGTYGLVVVHRYERKIVVARKGSPLILGIGDGEMFVASDVPAILKHTRKVVYMEDNEVAELMKDRYEISKLHTGEVVDKEVDEIRWNIEEVEKKGFKHFMLKEIYEQPDAVTNSLRGRIKDKKIKLSLNLDFDSIKRIVIVACGTSWHSALIGKYLIENIVGVPVEVDYASEFRYRNPIIGQNDLVIVISQSGETADTLAALREAKKCGAKSVGFVNVVGSTIARETDSGVYLHAGPEIGVASTKAFSCQVVSLFLFALYFVQKKGKSFDEVLIKEVFRLPDKLSRVFDKSLEIKGIAEKFKDYPNFLFLGRGINFPVAVEGALKLKEISYIHAEGYPAAEMKHGPIALVDENMPVVFLATRGNVSEKTLSNMEEVKTRGGKIIAVVNDAKDVFGLADEIISVPEVPELLSPIVNVVPLQLFAYYVSDLKGIDVDKPRNLAKSVTVE